MSRPLRPDELGPRLAAVYQVLGPLYRRVLHRVERDQAATGMAVGVRAVLDELTVESPLTVPAITRRLELSRQFVQRMVTEAREAGWIELLDNPAHRRSSLITPTPAGLEAIQAVHQREHELLGRVSGDLTDDDVATTLRVLLEMRAAVNRLDGR